MEVRMRRRKSMCYTAHLQKPKIIADIAHLSSVHTSYYSHRELEKKLDMYLHVCECELSN